MTLTDIANRALEAVGGDAINNIEDDTATARKIRRALYCAIDDVQSMRNWGCLSRKGELVLAAEPSETECEFKFIAPKNLIAIVETFPPTRFERIGGFIYAEVSKLSARWIVSNYEPMTWCKNLQGAVIAKLKAEIVLPVVGNERFATQTIQLAERDIARYIMNDISASKDKLSQHQSTWFEG